MAAGLGPEPGVHPAVQDPRLPHLRAGEPRGGDRLLGHRLEQRDRARARQEAVERDRGGQERWEVGAALVAALRRGTHKGCPYTADLQAWWALVVGAAARAFRLPGQAAVDQRDPVLGL